MVTAQWLTNYLKQDEMLQLLLTFVQKNNLILKKKNTYECDLFAGNLEGFRLKNTEQNTDG